LSVPRSSDQKIYIRGPITIYKIYDTSKEKDYRVRFREGQEIRGKMFPVIAELATAKERTCSNNLKLLKSVRRRYEYEGGEDAL